MSADRHVISLRNLPASAAPQSSARWGVMERPRTFGVPDSMAFSSRANLLQSNHMAGTPTVPSGQTPSSQNAVPANRVPYQNIEELVNDFHYNRR